MLAAQRVYFDYWAHRGVDVRPFFAAVDGGRADVATMLGDAQATANAAAQR